MPPAPCSATTARRGPLASWTRSHGPLLAGELDSISGALRTALTALDDDEQLLAELDETTPRNDGGLSVAPEDAPTVMDALDIAAACREQHGPPFPQSVAAIYRDLIARLGERS